MRLISRWLNSAGERVRIALNLKDLPYEYVPKKTLGDPAFREFNPQGLLPTLEIDGRMIAQSAAILDYLEETYPEPPLLPAEPMLRAQSRAFGAHIAAEMHALTVQRVRLFVGDALNLGDPGIQRWNTHWLSLGFSALEISLARRATDWPFCFGETPGWADLHLVPQVYNARRFKLDLSPYPLLTAIDARCREMDAFARARPEAQLDYPGEG